MRKAILCLALAAVLVAPRLAAGEPAAGERHAFEKEVAFNGDDGAPADARPQSAWSAFGGFVGYAIVIVLLIAGVAVVAKKVVPGARRFSASDAIQVLGRRNLTPQASLFLIQVGRRVLRVGLVKDGMSYLGEVADADEVALIRGQCLGTNEASAFKEALDSQMKPEAPSRREAPIDPVAVTMADPEPAEEPAASDAVRNELEAIRKVVNGWRASA